MPEFNEWESFYVLVGGAAGALIGLQFVVMTLIADRPPLRAPRRRRIARLEHQRLFILAPHCCYRRFCVRPGTRSPPPPLFGASQASVGSRTR